MIDARHVENPPEMSRFVAIRRMANGFRTSGVGNGKSGLDSISVPGVQGQESKAMKRGSAWKSCLAVHSL
jgi:hypothetical protein